jgi:site-specific DNA-methyltransferase (adenine-specific)
MDAIDKVREEFMHSESYVDALLVKGDCNEVLEKTPTNSVALVIIDPPYGAQTQNSKSWDVAWTSDFWLVIIYNVFRVLKKGGHLIVFSGGKTLFAIHEHIYKAYTSTFKRTPSFYHMIWYHKSQDSGRPHAHLPRHQFENINVYYRTGEGKLMASCGTYNKNGTFDEHVGRHDVFEIYKDDCRSKPYPSIQDFFKHNTGASTFDMKPEALMRALVRDYSSQGHTVMDLCMNHGITGVACLLERRKFIGVEKSSDGFAYANKRFHDQFPTNLPVNDVASSSTSSIGGGSSGDLRIESDDDEDAAYHRIHVAAKKARSILKTVAMIRKKDTTVTSNLKGKIVSVGTNKTHNILYILDKVLSIDGDKYLVAYPDDLNHKKHLHVSKKDIQEVLGVIPDKDMERLESAEEPRFF